MKPCTLTETLLFNSDHGILSVPTEILMSFLLLFLSFRFENVLKAQAAEELASLVDPKVAAINIVSQLDRQQANQSSGFGGPIKKPLGPAETGSLKKHKEILNTKYQNKQTNNLSSGFNFCDFDSSDSSLGSYEDLSLRPADQSNTSTTTPSTHPLNNQSEHVVGGGIRSHSVGKPYNPDPKKSLNHDQNLGYKNSTGLSSATSGSGVYQSEYDSSDSQPKLIRRASGSDTNPYPTHAPITGPTNTGPLDDNGFAILKSGGQMSDNMTSGNSKIDLSYSGSNLGSNITGSNPGSNVTSSNQSTTGITKRSVVSSNNVRKIANNFEPVESPRKLNAYVVAY